ncbi:aspartate aminotransferase [candidate division TA06 bacterium DG_78]|uniref:Aminotransferase n=1 Tax=candidate division TA06 bacterium DG_78 TaxID=1703772 RepID=A0A0S7YGZ9_UNCT6|nr:MAG: aspartate aminotransferase [candidate division TA06 bacterium DG_78]
MKQRQKPKKVGLRKTALSNRATHMPYSAIRKLASFADDAKKRGVKVFHLNIGQPDIETPKEIFEAIANYREKVLGYGPSGGLLDLRLTVAEYHRTLGFNIDLDNVWITTGGSEAIIFAMMTVCDPGDEIMVFEPFYTNYNGFAVMAQLKLVPITTRVEDGFRLPVHKTLEKKITPRTKALIINTPNNPTGTVLNEEEMFIIHSICKKYGLFLLSDEVYREFVYDGKRQISALSLPEVEEQVIVMDSISKRFSACGARVGSIVCRNKDIMDALIRFCQARLCPPTLEQVGAIAAYKNIDRYIQPMISEYEHRRNVLFENLQKIPGVYGHKPEGAFYTVLRLPVNNADKFCQWLLTDFNYKKKTVMLAPANGFYSSAGRGFNEVRIAYVLKEEDLRQAIEVLTVALEAYKG